MSARRNYFLNRNAESFHFPGFIYKFQSVKSVFGFNRYGVQCLIFLMLPVTAIAGQEILHIKTSASGTIAFEIEIAATAEQRRRGLMHRTRLPQQSGMLLDYKTPREVSIWMKNTYIPLDIIFINKQGEIIKIHRNAEPESLDTIHSVKKVLAVFEVNAGVVDQYSIRTGDILQHAIFER